MKMHQTGKDAQLGVGVGSGVFFTRHIWRVMPKINYLQ